MSGDPCFLTIAEAGRLIASKALSPVELTEAYLRRIEAIDRHLHSYILVTADVALADARAAESEIAAGRYRGPLHGIPYGLKDNIETAGIPTTANSRLLIDNVPSADAPLVTKLKDAGGVLLGKTALREFAKGTRHDDLPWPYPLNPWNRAHEFAGGSSTGSAAAVAASLAAGAIGTDTGGSVRNPSGFCGLAGIKPTYGRISRRGVIPNTFSLDQCGPMTWTVEDCALMLNVIAGYDSDDPGSADVAVPDFTNGLGKGLKGLRIGVIRHFYEDRLDSDDAMRRAFETAVSALADLGATVVDVTLDRLDEYHACKVLLSEAEFYAVHEKDLQERRHLFGTKMARRVSAGMFISAADYIHAQRRRHKLTRSMVEAFRGFDAMVTLTTLGSAPLDEPEPEGRTLQGPNLTTPFSVSGFPAMSIPTGFDDRGLPLAMQIIAKPFDEAMVFQVGHAYERATPWRAKRPVLDVVGAA